MEDAGALVLKIVAVGTSAVGSLVFAILKIVREDTNPIYAAAQAATGLAFLCTLLLLGFQLITAPEFRDFESGIIGVAITIGLLAVTLFLRWREQKQDDADRAKRKAAYLERQAEKEAGGAPTDRA